jgi:hypothetical protein
MRLRIERDSAVLDLTVRIGSKNLLDYEIVNAGHLTEAQRARRAAWMRAEAETRAAH